MIMALGVTSIKPDVILTENYQDYQYTLFHRHYKLFVLLWSNPLY